MAEQYIKFLNKLSPALQEKFKQALFDIVENNLGTYDIKPLQGKKDTFRLRIGKYRVIFLKKEEGNRIIRIQERGGVYKKI